jgi:ABC-type nitrate/sulfonate/bicarbonate transport system permease component
LNNEVAWRRGSARSRLERSALNFMSDRRARRVAVQVVMVALIVGSLEVISRADTEFIPTRLFPPPSRIATAFIAEIQRADFWQATASTLASWGAGWVLGSALAVPIGLAIAASVWSWRSLKLLIEILRPLPSAAILPLLILTLGITVTMKILVITWACFWPTLFQVLYGVRDVDPVAWEMARAYRVGRLRRFTTIVIPTMLPYLATGLRLSAVLALGAGVGTELLVGPQGIGRSIYLMDTGIQRERMWVYVFVAGLIGLAITITLRQIERRMLSWHPSQRGRARTL